MATAATASPASSPQRSLRDMLKARKRSSLADEGSRRGSNDSEMDDARGFRSSVEATLERLKEKKRRDSWTSTRSESQDSDKSPRRFPKLISRRSSKQRRALQQRQRQQQTTTAAAAAATATSTATAAEGSRGRSVSRNLGPDTSIDFDNDNGNDSAASTKDSLLTDDSEDADS